MEFQKFRLAHELGIPVYQLEAEMPSSEFYQWLAYQRIVPFSDIRSETQTGQLLATMIDLVRSMNSKVSKQTNPLDVTAYLKYYPDYQKKKGNIDQWLLMAKSGALPNVKQVSRDEIGKKSN